jgi:undecaprenyl-diphosphatase
LSLRWACAAQQRPLLRLLSATLARSGDGLACLVVGGLLYGLAPGARGAISQAVAAAVLVAAPVTALKFSVRRPRPPGPQAEQRRLIEADVYSFPSGHAARAAAIACSLGCAPTPWPAALWLWALGVAWARVAKGAHYVSDIVVGLSLGALAGSTIAWLWPLLP